MLRAYLLVLGLTGKDLGQQTSLRVFAVAFLVFVVPHFVWRRWYYGWWLPNTFYAKTGPPLWGPGWRYVGTFAWETQAGFAVFLHLRGVPAGGFHVVGLQPLGHVFHHLFLRRQHLDRRIIDRTDHLLLATGIFKLERDGQLLCGCQHHDLEPLVGGGAVVKEQLLGFGVRQDHYPQGGAAGHRSQGV